ncbi:hypothetical protein [Treponema primitia]|uniref:hypothetical protein n=1 Tax=Treponema primitia TaxID=88058 RepID=UPI00025555C4|nr:hypothetical protein [Treponema primitia]
MYRKLFIAKIILALGIPVFPLGALFYASQNRPPIPREELAENVIIPVTLPDIPEKKQPQTGADQLALIFRPPINKPASKTPVPENPVPGDGNTDPIPIPGEEKFSYLGLIRETDNQEWLYLKDRESGRIISINAGLVSADAEYSVINIDGTQYFIRRN